MQQFVSKRKHTAYLPPLPFSLYPIPLQQAVTTQLASGCACPHLHATWQSHAHSSRSCWLTHPIILELTRFRRGRVRTSQKLAKGMTFSHWCLKFMPQIHGSLALKKGKVPWAGWRQRSRLKEEWFSSTLGSVTGLQGDFRQVTVPF